MSTYHMTQSKGRTKAHLVQPRHKANPLNTFKTKLKKLTFMQGLIILKLIIKIQSSFIPEVTE